MNKHSPVLESGKEFQNRSQQLSMPENKNGLTYRGIKTACDLGNGRPMMTLLEVTCKVCRDKITVV